MPPPRERGHGRAAAGAPAGPWRRFRLEAGYNAFYGRSGPTEVARCTWRRFFDGYEPVHAPVAARGGALPDLAHYPFHRSAIPLGPSCYLQDLFTAEAARGQGVGRALIETACAQAQRAGAERVYWQTHASHAAAMRLHGRVATRSGFPVYRRPPRPPGGSRRRAADGLSPARPPTCARSASPVPATARS